MHRRITRGAISPKVRTSLQTGWKSFYIQGSRGGDPFWLRGQPTIGWIGELDGTRYGNYLAIESLPTLTWTKLWKIVQGLLEQGALVLPTLQLQKAKGPDRSEPSTLDSH